jgi:hypothetical protein
LVNCPLLSGKMKLRKVLTVLALAAEAVALSIGGKQMHVERDSDGLQNVVSFACLQYQETYVET